MAMVKGFQGRSAISKTIGQEIEFFWWSALGSNRDQGILNTPCLVD